MKIINQLVISLILPIVVFSAHAQTPLSGLQAPVEVVRDSSGIPHIFAENEHDVFFMQGWVHAQDRLFQMDTARRQIAGTLAELLGTAALESDGLFRTLGLHIAAERSLDAHPKAFKDLLQAYSNGVNAFIDFAESAGLLPPEYAALQLTQVARWTPLDSVMVGKGLGAVTSLDPQGDIELTVTLMSYQAAGSILGFDGNALFFEDLQRSAPFDLASTVPDAEQAAGGAVGLAGASKSDRSTQARAGSLPDFEQALAQARGFLRKLRELPKTPGIVQPGVEVQGGSNTWVISGEHTRTRRPLLANDIHLELNNPAIFHQVHLVAPGLDVIGSGVPGAPCVVRGHNMTWGITNARLDITDVYAEAIVVDPTSPSGLSIIHEGALEPIEARLESFLMNVGGVLVPAPLPEPFVVLTVPRRNNGPLITKPEPGPVPGVLTALSVQSTGFSATRDPEGFCGINRARNLNQFKSALQLVDFGSQNISYADIRGNIAYFLTGEVPLREDLQAAEPGDIVAPPFLIRDGTGGQEWIPLANPPREQAVAFEILPFEEMPQTVNPASGVIINANNDQAGNSLDNNSLNDFRPGGGLYYLQWGGRNFSIRAGRITQLLNERLSDNRPLAAEDMSEVQADVVMLDAEVFTPSILQAFDHATAEDAHPALAALAANPGVAEAVERLRGWDYSTPTGIAEGYDAGKGSEEEQIRNSIAATLFAVWRHDIVANTIDATLASIGLDEPLVNVREERVTALRNLLDNFETNEGYGASGLNFFPGPADADAATRRDIKILQSLADTLDQLASDDFKTAFNNSVEQDDYRWGRLHRIVFTHPFGGAFNVPPALGLFPPPLDDLAGIPTDGGFETIDVGSPAVDIEFPGSDAFMFNAGATGRFVSEFRRGRQTAVTSLPGGESAIPFTPFYLNLLEPWLLNETHPLLVAPGLIQADAYDTQTFVPVQP